MYVCSVYKESLRHSLSIEVKDHKFWRFKAHLYNHHSSKPERIPDAAQFAFVPKHCLNVVPHEKITIQHHEPSSLQVTCFIIPYILFFMFTHSVTAIFRSIYHISKHLMYSKNLLHIATAIMAIVLPPALSTKTQTYLNRYIAT